MQNIQNNVKELVLSFHSDDTDKQNYSDPNKGDVHLEDDTTGHLYLTAIHNV